MLSVIFCPPQLARELYRDFAGYVPSPSSRAQRGRLDGSCDHVGRHKVGLKDARNPRLYLGNSNCPMVVARRIVPRQDLPSPPGARCGGFYDLFSGCGILRRYVAKVLVAQSEPRRFKAIKHRREDDNGRCGRSVFGNLPICRYGGLLIDLDQRKASDLPSGLRRDLRVRGLDITRFSSGPCAYQCWVLA